MVKNNVFVYLCEDNRRIIDQIQEFDPVRNKQSQIYHMLIFLWALMNNPKEIGKFERLELGSFVIGRWQDKIDGKTEREKKFKEELEKLKEKYQI